MTALKLGSRGSELALFQANAVAAHLRQRAGVETEIVVIKTAGDRLAEAKLSQIGGKRLFVKEIEEALVAGEIDVAVHSSKDMPAVLPDGLEIGAVLEREDPRDAVVLRAGGAADLPIEGIVRELGREPLIGTSSVRRMAQLTRIFPGARFVEVRGNLGTRLRKLDAGEFDALILAAAGLRRLQRRERISASLPVDACVPAPGQGIIAVEIRSDDERTRELVARIDDTAAGAALAAETALVRRVGGGCQMPIGAYAHLTGETLSLTSIVVSLDGARAARAEMQGWAAEPEAVGASAGELLLARGAADILAEVRRAQAAVEGLQP